MGEEMKAPKYCVETTQQAINLGLNGFALTLMAESFADAPVKFDNENVAFLAHAHNGQEVWFIMTKTRPRLEDFEATDKRTSPTSGSDKPNSNT